MLITRYKMQGCCFLFGECQKGVWIRKYPEEAFLNYNAAIVGLRYSL